METISLVFPSSKVGTKKDRYTKMKVNDHLFSVCVPGDKSYCF